MRHMSEREAILARCALFQGLSAEDLASLAGICTERLVERGGLIFVEGSPANSLYLVAQGQVKIFKSNREGREIILHVCGPVGSFAEVPVFNGTFYPASASATQPTRLLCIPRERLSETIAGNPTLSLNMMANFAQKLRRFTTQIEILTLKEVPARIASHLLYLDETQKASGRVTLRLAKGQLANLLGTTPETLSRVFAKLTETAVIKMKGREIVILDRDELQRMADN